MAGGATSTGVSEMMAGIEQLSKTHELALRAVAWRISRNVYAAQKQLLISHQKTMSRKLAGAMEIVEDAAKHEFRVLSHSPAGQPDNVPLWNELGTIYMTARPYMRPALNSQSATYRSEMEAASLAAVAEALK